MELRLFFILCVADRKNLFVALQEEVFLDLLCLSLYKRNQDTQAHKAALLPTIYSLNWKNYLCIQTSYY